MAEIITQKTELLYEPPPFVEESFWEAYNKIVPDVLDAPAGTKKLRFVWGMDRLEYCSGTWKRRYGDTDNDPPKYVGRERWVIEGWQPPTVYDRADWAKHETVLGDFPENGVWDFVAFHEDMITKEYLHLDQSAINHLEMWAHWQGAGKNRSIDVLMAQKTALWERREKEEREAGMKVAMDFGEKAIKILKEEPESRPAFSLPSGYTKTTSGLIVPH